MASRRSSRNRKPEVAQVEFPLAESSGFLVRDANRAFQRLLEKRIASYGVARGQWYFLRVLWNEDGLSQRELSARVGMMEPTTVIALRSMEKSGLIRRVRSTDDRRRSHVWLTSKAQRLRTELLDARARHHRCGGGRHQPRRACAVPSRDRAHDRQSRPDQDVGRHRRFTVRAIIIRESG